MSFCEKSKLINDYYIIIICNVDRNNKKDNYIFVGSNTEQQIRTMANDSDKIDYLLSLKITSKLKEKLIELKKSLNKKENIIYVPDYIWLDDTIYQIKLKILVYLQNEKNIHNQQYLIPQHQQLWIESGGIDHVIDVKYKKKIMNSYIESYDENNVFDVDQYSESFTYPPIIKNKTIEIDSDFVNEYGEIKSIITHYKNSNTEILYYVLQYDAVEIGEVCCADDMCNWIRKWLPQIIFKTDIVNTPPESLRSTEDYLAFHAFYAANIVSFLEPISYLSGGLLGDFIHQLSIINEKYKCTGRKGILYISDNVGSSFQRGCHVAYSELYNIIIAQDYIADFRIHEGEQYDINLSSWRQSLLLNKANYRDIFHDEYQINWATNPWLHVDPDIEFQTVTLVSHSDKRWSSSLDYKAFFEPHLSNGKVIFIAFLEDEYISFISKTGINIPFHHASTIYDMASAIRGCRYFIGNLSSPLSFAVACHVPCTAIINDNQSDLIRITDPRLNFISLV